MQETTFCEIIELEPLPWQHTDSPHQCLSQVPNCFLYNPRNCSFQQPFLLHKGDSPSISCSFDDMRSVWTTVVPSLWLMNWHHCVNWNFKTFQYLSVFFRDAPSNVSSVLFFLFLQGWMRRIDDMSSLKMHFLIYRRILLHLAALHQNFCSVQDFWSWKHALTLNSTMYRAIHELNRKSNSIAFVYSCANLLVWAAIHNTHLLLHYRTTSRLFLLFSGSAPAVPFLIIATNSE